MQTGVGVIVRKTPKTNQLFLLRQEITNAKVGGETTGIRGDVETLSEHSLQTCIFNSSR